MIPGMHLRDNFCFKFNISNVFIKKNLKKNLSLQIIVMRSICWAWKHSFRQNASRTSLSEWRKRQRFVIVSPWSTLNHPVVSVNMITGIKHPWSRHPRGTATDCKAVRRYILVISHLWPPDSLDSDPAVSSLSPCSLSYSHFTLFSSEKILFIIFLHFLDKNIWFYILFLEIILQMFERYILSLL